MTEREWRRFFELLDKIVNAQEMTYQDKRNEVRKKADEMGEGDRINLEEFASWFDEE